MIIRIVLIILALLYSASELYCQTPSFYHYTTNDGLASSTVHNIIQDKDGFIWMATVNGLNRFDGSEFIRYGVSDGLNSNSLTALLERKDGKIYVGNHEKGINVLTKKKIEKYYDESIGKKFNITQMVESNDILYAFETYGFVGILNKGKATFLHTNNLVINRLANSPNGNVLALTSKGLYVIKSNKLEKQLIIDMPDENIYSITWLNNESYLIGGNGKIYEIENNRVKTEFSIKLFEENIVFNILLDSQQNIWFSIKGRGLFYIPHGSTSIINIGTKLGLEKTQVNSLMQDNEGNLWVTTYGKGVYCLSNLHIKNYYDKDGLTNSYINCIQKSDSGKIIIGTINGISILDDGKIIPLKYNSGENVTGYINNFITTKNSIVVSLTSELAKSPNAAYKDVNFRFTRFQTYFKTKDGLHLFGGTGNNIRLQKIFSYIKYPDMFYVIGESPRLNRINYLFEDLKKNLWVATNMGLCKLTYVKNEPDIRRWKKTLFKNDPVLNSKIVFIYQDRKNNLWFAGSNGIAKIDSNNDSITSLLNINGYDLSSSTSITSDKLNRIWIGNMKGVFLLEGNTIKYINSLSGLASNEVLSLYNDELMNKLYIGTSNGMSVMDIQLFDHHKSNPPKIFINKVISGESTYSNYNDLEFDRDKNNVSVDISAINYSSPGSLVYKYKLNDSWFETNKSLLNFSSLQNGKYDLQVFAKTQNSDWSKPYFLTFVIKPGFTETVWFKAGFFLLLFSFAISLVLWRTKQKTKRISEQLELNERINSLKHEALSAMMNPHFIFNSLNSVQYLVNNNRNEEANEYIAMMAKLIRKNLDTAGNGFILLTEEIKRLTLYLNLERLRFQERFSYEIHTQAKICTDSIMIPNMIIQPFVENSLWHGIINSGRPGKVTVSFAFEDVEIDSTLCKSLMIKIIDNGIGIKEAKKNRKEDHVSKGIQIIEERLRLLSTKMELPKPIVLEDLSYRSINSQGTEVIISLPPSLYKDVSY